MSKKGKKNYNVTDTSKESYKILQETGVLKNLKMAIIRELTIFGKEMSNRMIAFNLEIEPASLTNANLKLREKGIIYIREKKKCKLGKRTVQYLALIPEDEKEDPVTARGQLQLF